MKKIFKSMVVLLVLVGLVGCGDDANTLRIYGGDFTEPNIIYSMVEQLVEAETDLEVKIENQMTQVNSFNELISGNVLLMSSYDGTLLTTFLQKDEADVPEGTSLFDYANELATQEYNVSLFGKIGINNTYALAVRQDIADKYNLETISDLAAVAGELNFGAEHGFFTEEGSMKFKPFTEFYGLNFASDVGVDLGLKYSAVEQGQFDVVVVYATDGLNRKANLFILEDDKSYFPEYNASLLISNDLFEKYAESAPNLEEVLAKLNDSISDENMIDMTYAVDVEGKVIEDVAREFLVNNGLLD
ncbi:MAG: glycine betaine ABC transporter substrate-binding protein [Erysipelotrichaceae bacterium]